MEQSKMEQKFLAINFRWCGYSSRGCPLFQKSRKIMVHSQLEIYRKCKPEFLAEWNAAQTHRVISPMNAQHKRGFEKTMIRARH